MNAQLAEEQQRTEEIEEYGKYTQTKKFAEEIAKEITDAGYFASAWNIKRRKFSEYERLISWGVTEFTEDYHCSMGLNY